MTYPVSEALYARYQHAAPVLLSEREFGVLVLFFPALLVVAADGEIDREEQIYVDYLGRFMADTFKPTIAENEWVALKAKYHSHLRYLLSELTQWEKGFVAALADYIRRYPEVQPEVMEILHLFAEASDGLSQEEAAKINDLKKSLIG